MTLPERSNGEDLRRQVTYALMKHYGFNEDQIINAEEMTHEKANLEISATVTPEIAYGCQTFNRCLDCRSVSGGPQGFTMLHCSCGGETFVEATLAEFLAQSQPQN